ncbi:GAG-pre-integrase domain-containing protein, partial [Candidatus Bathyarchaeota archaeon]|nr:GAG-pre-integrase domain-containing protein [Candidatus Bathyarchaeota archaeon]
MHERLCHPGKDRLLRACREAGITLSKEEVASFHCEACFLGKSKEIVSRVRRVKHSTPDIFYADLITITPAANGIHKYALHIIEQTTGYHWIRGLKSKKKAETMRALNDFFT